MSKLAQPLFLGTEVSVFFQATDFWGFFQIWDGTLNVGYDLSYTYGTEAGKKFRLIKAKDVNYRTKETSGESNIENNHVYSHDKNGTFWLSESRGSSLALPNGKNVE